MTIYETSQRAALRERAEDLSARYSGLAAQQVLSIVMEEEFRGRIGLVSSFGAEAAVLLHMVAQIDPYTPVIFLDTWKHFPETLAYRDQLISELNLYNIQTIMPRTDGVKAEDPDGDLHQHDPDLCCHVRKTLPLLSALRGLDCWVTGRKRSQAVTRGDLALFDTQDRWLKLNPLLDWTAADVEAYFSEYGLPDHPLKRQGFLSIGCAPCTRAVRPGEDARAGRWADSEKTECGIHFENGELVRSGGGKRSAAGSS